MNIVLMREVTFNRKRFLQAIRLVAFVLQILCCISTLATFSRILDQYKLPRVFLILPCLLVFLLSIDRCLMMNDKGFNSIIRGATTGFLSGFFSNVVNDQFGSSKHTIKNKFVNTLCNLEFLHIPVIVGTTMCMFCFLFRRFPPLRITLLSFALATCCMSIFSLSILYFSLHPESSAISKTMAILVFLIVFLLGIMPSVDANKRAWLLCLIGYILSTYWQFNHLETSQWNWQMVRFPIPGFITPIIVLFLLDVVDFHESGAHIYNKRRRKFKRYDEESPDVDKHLLPIYEAEEEGDHVSTAITWHCICYIVERTTLTLIMERQYKHKQFRTDTWFCCLAMLCTYLLHVTYKHFSCSDKVVIALLGIMFYVCVGSTNGMISNGYFIDNIFGITFLSLSITSDFVVNV